MKLKTENGKEYIFDIVRKKYIINQPEEWVRQNIIQYLNKKKGYPISLMAVEKSTQVNKLYKRCDLICYDRNGKALLLVECKAPQIKLNSNSLNQGINYQKKINADYLLLTNGKKHFCFKVSTSKLIFLKKIPEFKS